jgi:hypothetical protein
MRKPSDEHADHAQTQHTDEPYFAHTYKLGWLGWLGSLAALGPPARSLGPAHSDRQYQLPW